MLGPLFHLGCYILIGYRISLFSIAITKFLKLGSVKNKRENSQFWKFKNMEPTSAQLRQGVIAGADMAGQKPLGQLEAEARKEPAALCL